MNGPSCPVFHATKFHQAEDDSRSPKEWADPANLKRVCDRIKARWENRSGESLPNNEELLISDGKLEKSVIEYLLRQRDESEINLFE
jgi:hypothetical protein